MISLVFWSLLAFEVNRLCPHGRWDRSVDGVGCFFCDYGQSE